MSLDLLFCACQNTKDFVQHIEDNKIDTYTTLHGATQDLERNVEFASVVKVMALANSIFESSAVGINSHRNCDQ